MIQVQKCLVQFYSAGELYSIPHLSICSERWQDFTSYNLIDLCRHVIEVHSAVEFVDVAAT